MDKIKKIGLVLFIFCLVCFNTSYAALDERIQNAAEQLQTLEILKGKDNGDLALNDKITRAEIATLILRITAQEDAIVDISKIATHKDIIAHWAEQNIKKSIALGYMKGYSDTEFGPNNNITYAEVVTLMIRLIGEEKNLDGDWPIGQINKAKTVGVLDDETLFDATRYSEPLTRGMVALLIYDTMTLNTNVN